MSKRAITACLLYGILGALLAGRWPVLAQDKPAEADDQGAPTKLHWDEFMHYALIGNWELARDHGQALLDANPNPILLLDLAESERYADSYRNLSLMQANTPLKEVAAQILKLIEHGRFIQRTDPERIAAEVKRLSGTTRGRNMAIERLKDSGEWAVPVMIEALRDPSRGEEFSVVRWALPQLGQPAVNPLVVALQRCPELNIKLIVLDALGKIGYQSALPYIEEIVESKASQTELKAAALAAAAAISNKQAKPTTPSAATAFEKLAEDYYNHLSSLEVPANQEFANVWFWINKEGLAREEVPRGAFDELMTMRCCEQAVYLNPNQATALSLWLSAFFRLEAEGYKQPAYFGENHADAGTYALTSGPEYLHRVLARALKNRNRPVALAAISALRRNSGQKSLLYRLGEEQPLITALTYADREVRFSAALTIGEALPDKSFQYHERVMPILTEALRQKGKKYAMVIDANQERRDRLTAELGASNTFTQVISDGSFGVALEKARQLPSFDLVVLGHDMERPDIEETLTIMQKDYRLAFCPTIVLSSSGAFSQMKNLKQENPFVEAVLENATGAEVIKAAEEVLASNQARVFDPQLADAYATAAADVLRQLAVTGNKVLDLKVAQAALIEATRDERPEIQLAATQTLARIDSTAAQRAIVTLALDEQLNPETRLTAFGNLAISAKAHGNLLLAEQVEGIYRIVSSLEVDSNLRNLAAQAYGALNLPSVTISQLIINQMQ